MGFFKKDKKEEKKPVSEVKKEESKKTTKSAPKKAKASNKKVVENGRIFDVLLAPRITEKTHDLIGEDKYVFKVAVDSNKKEIKKSVESVYGVTVEGVNVVNTKPKKRRFGRIVGKKAGFKKAIVTLKKGDKIEFFQGA